MSNLNITKGEWTLHESHLHSGASYSWSIHMNGEHFASAGIIYPKEGDMEQLKANAQLIADAGTTANKCGLLPSELLEQRDMLLTTMRVLKDLGKIGNQERKLLEETIQKCQ